MSNKKVFKVSIRNLIEFVMRSGSIDNRYVGSIKAVEGIKGHQKVQSSYGDNYSSEVPLKYIFSYEDIDIEVEGRADGILVEGDNVVIDEIKTTTRELLMIDEKFNPLHWAQAKCYGFIYCNDNNLDNIDIQITYYNIESTNTRMLRKKYSFEELKGFFYNLMNEYKYWCYEEVNWIENRNKSIQKLNFPFESYRKGQRDLAVRVYKSIEDNINCFAQAPTGIGKTISTLFPSIKAIGEGHTSKIFYLTAKTITREVAEDTISLMKNQNLSLRSVTITAKEKICNMDKVECNPEYCPYANGYFDRINSSLKEILKKYNDYSRESIKKMSEEFKLCPFELSLELTTLSDVIICDYNYVFDPSVYLKRFFDVKKTDYTFLIDEAHNLVDRAREMYSSTIYEEKILKVKKSISKKNKMLLNSIKDILNYFKNKGDGFINSNSFVEEEAPKDLYILLRAFLKIGDEYLSNNIEKNDELLELYFDIYGFVLISEIYDKNYVTLYKRDFSGINIKLYCVNPSKVIQDKMKKAKSNIVFSATLIPMSYFKDMYGFNENDHSVNLRSPFDVNNRLIMIGDNISTTYNKRNETCEQIIDYIVNCVEAREGNYMVFFPSYKYMNMVADKMKDEYPNLNLLVQENDMTEELKEEFLGNFIEENNKTNIGFCVLGGHFSEGIDLTNDKLIGVIIVGVGMPQIGVDRDIIKDHLNEENTGFDYAYVYPGIIKVLQAAGRCIRTHEDRGVILLIDTRYGQKKYLDLLPYDWFPNTRVREGKKIKSLCEEFWNN